MVYSSNGSTLLPRKNENQEEEYSIFLSLDTLSVVIMTHIFLGLASQGHL